MTTLLPLPAAGQRASTVKRLMALPDAFSATGFATLLGISPEVAAVHLSRWSAAGYVTASGRRTGFYFNVLKRHDAAQVYAVDALRHVYPTATVRGASVLHARGLTTQVPREVHVAVLSPANRAHTDGFVEVAKSRTWYEVLQSLNGKTDDGLFGLPALRPEVALADLFGSKDDWHPDIDDLEVDEFDWVLVGTACARLGAPVPEQFAALVQAAEPRPESHKLRRRPGR